MAIYRTADELAHIARNGGSFVVDGGRYTVENLAHVARNLKEGASLTIIGSERLSTENMAQIARNRAKGSVIFS